MDIPQPLVAMLAGDHGPTKQKAARLVVDLASTAGATEFVTCAHAHVSGVSPLTGGHGLRRFLADLAGDEQGIVEIPTTLNSAGCDKEKMEEMDIEAEDFLQHYLGPAIHQIQQIFHSFQLFLQKGYSLQNLY